MDQERKNMCVSANEKEYRQIDEEIIDEFLKTTVFWVEQSREFQNQPCVMCGTIPTNMLKLSKALQEIRVKAWKYDQLSK
jgi:hypothetical protein